MDAVNDLAIQTEMAEPLRRRSVRNLKNQLQSRFPEVGSSHLTEAIACAFGFKTNAAMHAANVPELLAVACFDHAKFHESLSQNYDVLPDFRMGNAPSVPALNQEFLEILEAIKRIPAGHLPPTESDIVNQVLANRLEREAIAVLALWCGSPRLPPKLGQRYGA
jgi:hypothetical protein